MIPVKAGCANGDSTMINPKGEKSMMPSKGCFVSLWEPSPEEAALIACGGIVRLWASPDRTVVHMSVVLPEVSLFELVNAGGIQ